MRAMLVAAAALLAANALTGCDEAADSRASAEREAEAAPRPRADLRPVPAADVFSPNDEPASGSPEADGERRWGRSRAFFDGGGYGSPSPAPALAASAPKTVVYTAAPASYSPADAVVPPSPSPRADAGWRARIAAYGERKMREGGTVGLCYGGVKRLLRHLEVVTSFTGDKRWRDGDGRAVRENELVSAYQFTRWVSNHPSLHGRRLLRVERPTSPPEIGDIVVWSRGTCGYSADHGHIEMIYRVDAAKGRAWAVSDHSQEFASSCYAKTADRVSRARAALPDLRAGLARAEEADRQARLSRDRKAMAARRPELVRARRAAAAAEWDAGRLEVYRVERPVVVAGL